MTRFSARANLPAQVCLALVPRLVGAGLALAAAALSAAPVATPADKINPMIGTTGPKLNYGGVCPWVTPPFGMTHWTPMTQENGISRLPYRSDQATIIGFMGTHQPTVWMGDYGFLTLMPETGKRRVLPQERGLEIVPNSEVAKPFAYLVRLQETNRAGQVAVPGPIAVELTGSSRCALFRITYPKAAESHLMFEMGRLAGYEGWVRISPDRREILGYNSGRHNIHGGRHMGPELMKFRGYYVIQFEEPFPASAVWDAAGASADFSAAARRAAANASAATPQIHDDRRELKGERVGAFASFPADPGGRTVKFRIGSSFISLDQARENLRREIPDWDFDRVAARNKLAWNQYLNRIEIEGGTPDEQTVFYTAMHHSLLFPRTFDEYGRYYSAFDENIHSGVSYNDYSMWDTFRALHPLLTLVAPEHVSPMIRSLLQMFDEGGWMPKWPNPTYSNIMIGTPADAIIADAYVKGFRDYDLHKAYAAIYKDAMTPPDGDEQKRWGDRAEWTSYEARAGLTYYKKLGYVPVDKTAQAVSCTLEYAFEDYCVAQVAKGLGKDDDYLFFMKRAQNYRNLFNPATGFMQGRLADGKFYVPDSRKYGGFTEGSEWTYLFCVMQDVPGLIDLMGREAFISKLDENFSGGHFAYDNEPENHYIYLYDWVGQPEKAQKLLTETVRKNYRNSTDGIQGNDDCGQMSAWYIFTALGFYPVAPASGSYAIGRPFFPKVVVHLDLPSRNAFTILARNLSSENNCVKSIKLDGRPLLTPFLKHTDLLQGKVLEFGMGAK